MDLVMEDRGETIRIGEGGDERSDPRMGEVEEEEREEEEELEGEGEGERLVGEHGEVGEIGRGEEEREVLSMGLVLMTACSVIWPR